jgi:DNA-binding MarR family transcriptional regulator
MAESNTFKYRKLQSCKCSAIRKSSRIITQYYDKKLKPINLKITQFSIISLIAISGNKTMNALSDDLMMDRTTLTRGLDILYKQKLIENVKTPDARKRVVRLTKLGFNLLEKAIPLWEEAEKEIFDECKKHGISAM